MITSNKTLIKKCKPILKNLLENELDRYIDLFFYEKEIDLIKKEDAIVLEKAGILKRRKTKWYADVMVFPFRGKFIVTDFLLSIRRKKGKIFMRHSDDVWSLYPFETLDFINSLDKDLQKKENKRKIALDIASGSGAISIFLAERFKKVISADTNPKAVHYARFNAVLNDLENKILNVKSDIFSDIKEYKFDYIVWNGPTGAVPEIDKPKEYYPQYFYGGADGTEFTKKFLRQVFKYVKKDFKIKFLDASLGTNKICVTEKFILEDLSSLPINVKIDYLNSKGGEPQRNYDKLYDKYCLDRLPMNIKNDKNYKQAFKKWKEELKKRKLYYLYFSYISITQGRRFNIKHTYPKKSSFLPKHNFGFEWHYVSRKYIRKYIKKYNQKN